MYDKRHARKHGFHLDDCHRLPNTRMGAGNERQERENGVEVLGWGEPALRVEPVSNNIHQYYKQR